MLGGGSWKQNKTKQNKKKQKKKTEKSTETGLARGRQAGSPTTQQVGAQRTPPPLPCSTDRNATPRAQTPAC
eukprot:NODE_8028_length_375_cov_45.993865_g6303_i0.p3 GENE.NODE_8028_length_375_cov_45.993865_g6303_i0~~NODE_8028_length_375_cov_45.993865_g6303_i0.p3  ORF type:complete len:72 (+),score=13.39 NODE_8028_length_375_cov_45.993865_g6303_i0:65-280(+)